MVKSTTKQSLDNNEKAPLKGFLAACEPFDNIRHTMPLQYIRAFLLVALEEGLGVNEYAQRSGVSQSVMSRHLLDLGERNRYMKAGFGLLTQRPDPLELRKQQTFLTDKGRTIAHRIIRELSK